MTLQLDATLTARNVKVSLTIQPGETVALMGPNGAGKSSVIHMLAGLVQPSAGSATLDTRTLFKLAPGNQWRPPHQRGVGVLTQEPLLFPHLTVLDNVAFGPRSQGAGRAASRNTARHWLGEVDAVELSARYPAELSGGQAQRVALARALATDPHLLLLDEPMAALDVNSAPFLRSLLKRVLAGRRAIIVTHNVLDALMLAQRILVMEAGRIVESGPTATVLAHPRSVFAASLAGLNVLPGMLSGSTLLLPDGGHVTGSPVDGAGGGAGLAAFPPSAVSVFLTPPTGSPRNSFPVTVDAVEPHGSHIRVRAGLLAADISAAATAELGLVPGTEVFFVVKAAEVVLYPSG